MADQTIFQETLDNNIVDGDWLIYWKTSTGVQRRVARSSLLGATLTGAGTIATGGFTLTVPATGTAALKTGTPTAGQVAQWNDANTVESAGFAASDVALLAGRSGGQSLSGGTAANDDLTLQGTTNATRTTSYVIMQPNGGNVGIGTTGPVYPLDVKVALDTIISFFSVGSTGWINSRNVANTSNQPLTIAGSTIGFDISNTQKVLIDTNGIGIGTASTVYPLDVKVASDTIISFFSVGSTGWINSRNVANTSNQPLTIAGSTIGFDISGTQKVSINTTGVGIETTSPSTRLDIDNGALELAEMTAPGAGAANTVRIYAVDNGAGKTQLMAIFNTGAAQQLAIQP